MKDRCVASPTYIFADGNLNMHEGNPQRAIMCVMSARDFRPTDEADENLDKEITITAENLEEEMTKYQEESKAQTDLFVKASLAQGSNMIIDCGFGLGAFGDTGNVDWNKSIRDIFATTWVDRMVQEIKANPNLQVVLTHHDNKFLDLIRNKLEAHPAQSKNITLEDKMTVDIAYHAAKNGFIPSFRVAGDPSGIMGQYATQEKTGIVSYCSR